MQLRLSSVLKVAYDCNICSTKSCLTLQPPTPQNGQIRKILNDFLVGNKIVFKLFEPLCYESRMFEMRFLCLKSVKEMEKRRVRNEQTGFEVKRDGLQPN